MKKKVLLGLFCLSLFIVTINAQTKVAHINVQELLSEMPEMKSVQSELKELEASYTKDIKSSMKELQAKASAYQNEAKALTKEELTSRQDEFKKKAEELQSMESNIQQARKTASNELQKKQEEMLVPVMKKAQDAIQKIAKEKGFHYVLDATPGGGVILSEGMDLKELVKKELGF